MRRWLWPTSRVEGQAAVIQIELGDPRDQILDLARCLGHHQLDTPRGRTSPSPAMSGLRRVDSEAVFRARGTPRDDDWALVLLLSVTRSSLTRRGRSVASALRAAPSGAGRQAGPMTRHRLKRWNGRGRRTRRGSGGGTWWHPV